MMDQEAQPQEAQAGGGPEDAMKGIQSLQQAMQAMMQGLQSAPPEVQEAGAQAMQAFDNFVAMLTGGGQKGAVPAQGGAENAAGNPGARPMSEA